MDQSCQSNDSFQIHCYTFYGQRLSDAVCTYYCQFNPLKRKPGHVSYWYNVKLFLDNLHRILLNPNHNYSVKKITTEHYDHLTKISIDRSFDIEDLIYTDNMTNRKLTKQISHMVLPSHIALLNMSPTIPVFIPYIFQPPAVHPPVMFQTPSVQPPVTFQIPSQPPQAPPQAPPQVHTLSQPSQPQIQKPKPKVIPILKAHSNVKKEEPIEVTPILIPGDEDTDISTMAYDCFRPTFNGISPPIPKISHPILF
jgi:hypothetical protein